MRRGSTPTQTFSCPYEAKDVAKTRVTYVQENRQVLVKEGDACILDGQYLHVKLSQEETLRFKAGVPCEAQVRVLFKDGTSIPSSIVTFRVERLLDDEVMK